MKLAIVDDNEIEQEIILNTLNVYHKESGISLEIQSFSDGDSFLNAYKSGNYDLIFMDIFLKCAVFFPAWPYALCYDNDVR